MILRVVHAAVPPEKKDEFVQFIRTELAPALRNSPGCNWVYVSECIEKGHEGEILYVSGWDSLEQCEALEKTGAYRGAANKAKTLYTAKFQSGAPHLHYDAFAAMP